MTNAAPATNELSCTACAQLNASDSQFCENCGASLIGAAAAAPAPPPPASQMEFLPGEGPSSRIDGTTTNSAAATASGTNTSGTSAPAAAPQPCVACGGAVDDTYCTVCGQKQPDPRDHFRIVISDQLAGVCDKGAGRSANQDAMALLAGPSTNQAVLVVCDGVTSAPLSERASLAAAEAGAVELAAEFQRPAGDRNRQTWAARLASACTASQGQTVAVARTLGDPPEPPSCTFVAAAVDVTNQGAIELHVGWCGDSRAYFVPDTGDAVLCSQDDSIATELIAAGQPRATAEADPRAHTITRWLGADAPNPTARTASFPVSSAGWVLVVSDGLWNYASEPEAVRAQMNNQTITGTALELCVHMVGFANSLGGVDNVTVTAFRINAPSSP